MVVKLAVVDNQAFNDPANFQVCCGAQVCDLLSESFIGDDQRLKPTTPESRGTREALAEEQARMAEWDAYHFPYLHDDAEQSMTRALSRPYLAVLVLGATGWSGYHDERGYWACTLDQLTDAGRALYQQIEQMYPNTTLHLLTFLDT